MLTNFPYRYLLPQTQHGLPILIEMDILSANLNSCLNGRKEDGRLMMPYVMSKNSEGADFASNDTLSLSSSRTLSKAFLEELDRNPEFEIGSGSSRCLSGTTEYLSNLEDTLRDFHGAEEGIIFNSGFDANVALWSTIPQIGDVVLYDEYVHASIHDGMRRGRAHTQSFRHNDCGDLRKRLTELKAVEEVAEGQKVVFVAVESFYSMDGDVVPLEEMVKVANEMLPKVNTVLVVDEAHSNGIVGPNGSGVVSHFGLERQIGLRVHTCGKALGSTGAVLLCNKAVKSYLINYARNAIFSTAPTFVTLAGIRAGYNLLASEIGHQRRHKLERNVQLFHRLLQEHPTWQEGLKQGIISVVDGATRLSGPFYCPIIAIVTRPGESDGLANAIRSAGYSINPVKYPIVPKNLERVRIMLHADNTDGQLQDLVRVIAGWLKEKIE
ncbi:PLP-dependent transferase [Penicillium verhagenii]|nr:PLP-dependent transferase [Penicillium verhagenii]